LQRVIGERRKGGKRVGKRSRKEPSKKVRRKREMFGLTGRETKLELKKGKKDEKAVEIASQNSAKPQKS